MIIFSALTELHKVFWVLAKSFRLPQLKNGIMVAMFEYKIGIFLVLCIYSQM